MTISIYMQTTGGMKGSKGGMKKKKKCENNNKNADHRRNKKKKRREEKKKKKRQGFQFQTTTEKVNFSASGYCVGSGRHVRAQFETQSSRRGSNQPLQPHSASPVAADNITAGERQQDTERRCGRNLLFTGLLIFSRNRGSIVV